MKRKIMRQETKLIVRALVLAVVALVLEYLLLFN